jgi:hypothetical protein
MLIFGELLYSSMFYKFANMLFPMLFIMMKVGREEQVGLFYYNLNVVKM